MKIFDHSSGAHLDVDGAKIYYEIAGNPEAPVLLFLHGGLGNIEEANSFLSGLNKAFRFIGIDSRGQGKSTLGAVPLSYERMQKDVERVLAHLGIDTLSIIGFSDGGIVAYRLAALASLKIEKVIAIGAHSRVERDDPVRAIYVKVTGESWRKKFPSSYETYQRLNPEPDFDRIVKSAVQMWLDLDGYPNEIVRNISCPVLLVRGDEDIFLSRRSAVELCDQITDSKLLNIAFATHVAFEDQKEIFLLGVNRFLDS